MRVSLRESTWLRGAERGETARLYSQVSLIPYSCDWLCIISNGWEEFHFISTSKTFSDIKIENPTTGLIIYVLPFISVFGL